VTQEENVKARGVHRTRAILVCYGCRQSVGRNLSPELFHKQRADSTMSQVQLPIGPGNVGFLYTRKAANAQLLDVKGVE
jgi:hypothetical protein